MFKSLVQFSTGPVTAVKGAKTTGNRLPSAVKVDGPMCPSTFPALEIKRWKKDGFGKKYGFRSIVI